MPRHRTSASAHLRPPPWLDARAWLAVTLAALLLICGLGARGAEAIIGGAPEDAGHLPWVALLLARAGSAEHFCSATVVAPRLILTAAHCVIDAGGEELETANLQVLSGSVNRNSPATVHSSVTAVSPFPGYLEAPEDDGFGDAALLVLAQPLSSPAVTLAQPGDAALWRAGAAAQIAGFGVTASGQQAPAEELQVAPTTIQSTATCEHFPEPPFHAAGQLCVLQRPGPEATGGCGGDSGGPLLATQPDGQIVEVGVIATGGEGCPTNRPTLATRADLIAGWLDEALEAQRAAEVESHTTTGGNGGAETGGAGKTGPGTAAGGAGSSAGGTNALSGHGGYWTQPVTDFHGRIRGGRRLGIVLGEAGRRVIAASITVKLACRHGGSVLARTAGMTIAGSGKLDAGRRFRARLRDAGWRSVIAGRILRSGTAAEGLLRTSGSIARRGGCGSGWIRWRAAPRRR